MAPVRTSKGAVASRASRIAFLVIFAITGYLFYKTMRPIFMWIGLAGFCAILTYAPYVRISTWLGGRRKLAAAICTLGVVLVIIAPMVLTGWAIVDQALQLAGQFQEQVNGNGSAAAAEAEADGLPDYVPEFLAEPIRRAQEWAPVSREQIREVTSTLAKNAAGVLTTLLTNATAVAIGIFLWLLSLFYFYVDGEAWLKRLLVLLPLPERYSIAFFQEFRSVSYAVFFGNILTALVQGVLGAIAFVIVGLPGVVLWGALIFFAGILPLVGAALVWGPAGIWLIVQGRVVAGVFMLVWGAVVVGTVDNILRPVLTKGQLEMHPLLVFLSIFGGLAAFGFVGILLGPLFAALFLAAVRIYAVEFPRTPANPPSDPDTVVERGIEAPVH